MINFFSHKDVDNKWASNHEVDRLWSNDSLKKYCWKTYNFIDYISTSSIKSTLLFNVSEYQESSVNGFYLIYYGRSQDIEDNLGFITLDPTVVQKVNSGQLKLLIAYVHETFDFEDTYRSWFWKLGRALTKLGITRANSVVFLTSSKNLSSTKFNDQRYFAVYYPWFEADFQQRIRYRYTDVPSVDFNKKSKTFINLNLAPRPHRYLLVMYLLYLKLQDHGNISWLDPQELKWAELIPLINGSYHGFKFNRELSLHKDFFYFVEQFKKIPRMELDKPSNNRDPLEFWTGADSYYEQSLFEVISETHHDLPGYSFLTEKSFKSIFHGLPFIINGPAGQLRSLQELGYQTFPELFNEQYDQQESSVQKIITVGNEVRDVCYSQDKLNYLKSPEILEKIKFNQQLFWNKDHATLIHDVLEEAWRR